MDFMSHRQPSQMEQLRSLARITADLWYAPPPPRYSREDAHILTSALDELSDCDDVRHDCNQMSERPVELLNALNEREVFLTRIVMLMLQQTYRYNPEGPCRTS